MFEPDTDPSVFEESWGCWMMFPRDPVVPSQRVCGSLGVRELKDGTERSNRSYPVDKRRRRVEP